MNNKQSPAQRRRDRVEPCCAPIFCATNAN